jgi:hypothetical protein
MIAPFEKTYHPPLRPEIRTEDTKAYIRQCFEDKSHWVIVVLPEFSYFYGALKYFYDQHGLEYPWIYSQANLLCRPEVKIIFCERKDMTAEQLEGILAGAGFEVDRDVSTMHYVLLSHAALSQLMVGAFETWLRTNPLAN